MDLDRGAVISCVWGGFRQRTRVRTRLLEVPEADHLRLPAAPNAGGKFAAKLDILVDGTVQLPVSVEPDDAEMTKSVNEAARFWLFGPELTDDCKPGPRSGKISFEYGNGDGKAWVELPALQGIPREHDRFEIVNPGDDIRYPDYEGKVGINAGMVTIAMKLMPDGSSSEPVVYVALPRSRGFMAAALYGAKESSVNFLEPLDRPFLCALKTYEFRME